MKKLISAPLSAIILLTSLVLVTIMHVLILTGALPYEIVWGGLIKSRLDLFLLEGIALGVTFLFIFFISVKVNYIKIKKLYKIAGFFVWILFIFLLLNTIGNLASDVSMEKWIFTPITILLSFFAFRLAIEK